MNQQKEIIQELLSRFPEFESSEERKEVYESDGAYIYFSYFCTFLSKEMDETEESEVVKRAFTFINEVFGRPNLTSDIWDLFNLELFDRFRMEEKYISLANKYLSGKAAQAFKDKGGRPG